MSITNKFFEALNDPKAALWSAGVAFNRSNPLPLDKWSVFQDKASAIVYAESNPVAYPGQVIAVYDNNAMQAFILAEVIVGEGEEATSKLNLQPIGIIPTGDGAISVSPEGVITLGVDNVTIEVVDGALTLLGYADAEEGAQLVKTETGLAWIKPDGSEIPELVENLTNDVNTLKDQIGQKSSVNEEGTEIPASGIYADIETLQNEKANAADVYTKDETEQAIKKQIDEIDHLKRKIVVSPESIDLTAKDADQYIYMAPNEDGTYDEYMVLEGELEKVGDWKVNLDAYATKEELENETKRAKVAESAALEAATAAQDSVDDLAEVVEGKADIVYYPVKDEETGETVQVPGEFLTPEDKEKLAALVIDKDGNVGMSGSVNADNVEGLGTWLTQNGNTYITGLTENNVSQGLLDKINYITSVTNNFTVVDGELRLAKVDQSQVDGLSEVLESKASIEGLNAVVSDVDNLNNIINGYTNENDEPVIGLVENVSKLNTKIANLEQANANLADTYVKKALFNSTVSDLTTLVLANEENIINLNTRVDGIESRLVWHGIED